MSDKLTIRITLGHHYRLYDLSYPFQQNEARINIKVILQKVNQFIMNIDYTVKNYLNIWIQTKNGRENLFKLKQKGTLISLGLNQNAIYELNIFLEDIEQKQNLMKFFHNSTDQYNRLNNNINRMIEESKQEEKKRGQKSLRPIDIAYFFADPLVAIQKGKTMAKHEVSYQLQYDKFIEIVKKQQFGNNFRVQMMVATKTNIKNTLFDGASILHFACHGKDKVGNLQIQSDSSIGQLVDLEHNQFLSLLDIRTALPKLIIFNVCYSSILAKKINETKNIMTIGYQGEAADIYCEMFTRQFYLGVFKDKRPVRTLFNEIKERILKLDSKQGQKLRIFPENAQPDQVEQQFLENTQTKFNFIKRWTLSQSMRQNDSLGVKIQMYQFIKQFLTRQTMSYLILKGQPKSGKSDFMKKVRIYIMNRKVFSQDVWIDLKNKKGQYIENILQLKLQKEDMIIKKVNEFKQNFKQKKFIPLVIFDHCQKIIKIQYSKFIEYIQNKIIKQIKFGKVILITNNLVPVLPQDEQKFHKAHNHVKQKPLVEPKQFQNFLKRYASSRQMQDTATRISKSNLCNLIDLVKALKVSKSQTELQDNIINKRQSSQNDRRKHELNMTLQLISKQLMIFSQKIEELRTCITIRVQENDFIFMSTIFNVLNIERKLQQFSSSYPKKEEQLHHLVYRFKKFYKKIFKFKKQDQQQFRALKNEISLKNIFEVSLGIAGILYFYGSFTLFEQHLLNCQTLHNYICVHYIEQLKKPQSQLIQLVHQYHLKILLTLYSYFTENYYKIYFLLHYGSSKNVEQDRKNCETYRKKYKIIENEIVELYFKDQYPNVQKLLKQIFIINEKIQQLHYNKKYVFFHEIEGRPRSYSQNFFDDDDDFDESHIISKIVVVHKSIEEYWQSFGKIRKYIQNPKFVISRQSIYIVRLSIIKLIYYNLRQFQQILQKGQSFITENLIRVIACYKEIMTQIYNEKPFQNKKPSNGLFNNHQCKCLKPLFQQYLKSYIEIYYNISILYQNFHKEFNLKIYYTLLELCDTFSTISGIYSIKKMIEEHLKNQFFNTWMCTIFIAYPLVQIERRNNSIKKRNVKRYEYSTISFIRNFYENQLDKEIKYGFKVMNKQILKDYEYNTEDSDKRNLIELVICDLKYNNEKNSFKLFMEDENGACLIEESQNINLPHAPIVIYFGQNIKEINCLYRNNASQSIIIWINIKQEDSLKSSTNLQKDRKFQLQTYNQYSIRLQIYYTVLQYFYCSFCRHFFNDDSHNYFIDQVKSSYDLAKAETLIKTKLKYSNDREFNYTSHIIQIVQEIDYNLNYLVKSIDGIHLRQRLAYSFIYKQVCALNNNATFKIDRKELPCQIGCNEQINELLYILNHYTEQSKTNIIIYYKSQLMMQFFINTLKAKLYKLGRYIITKDIIYQKNYYLFKQKLKTEQNSSISEDDNNIHYQQIVTFFVGLSEEHIRQQIDVLTPNKQTKLFFTNQRYASLKNINTHIIRQSYKMNRLEYQLYFLEYKRSKNLNADKQKKSMKLFYEMVDNEVNSSASLMDVRNTIDKVAGGR